VSAVALQEISPRHGQPAGIVSRGAAALVDFGVVWLISAAISLSVDLVQSVLGTDASNDLGALGAVLAGAALLFTYLSLCWIVGGRTLGQLLLGLRVRRVGGSRIGFFQAVARGWMATYLLALLLWSVVSRRSAAVWDVVLRTEVVYDWTKAEPHPK
ncbi:MAG: RDD family protein, partial [Acidimicrobiales bacterium]|nr:RDD family protein [Acidimicrobiales bacterium]